MSNKLKTVTIKKQRINVISFINLSLILLAAISITIFTIFAINFVTYPLSIFILVLSVVALILILSIIISLRRLLKPIDNMTEYAVSISKGNLNLSDISVDSNNNFSLLSIAFNNMKTNFLFFIEQTKNNFITISDAVDNLSRNVGTSYEGNEQIAKEVQEISLKTQEQLTLVEKTIENLSEVYKRVEDIVSNIKDTQEQINDTTTLTENGVRSIKEYNKQINVIYSNLTDTGNFIDKLKGNITEINSIIDFINGISVQLKMLALNASIEASKAGDAGKGFSVVAKETMKLSDQAKTGTTQITGLVKNIMTSSNSVSESINVSIRNFEKGKETFNYIDNVFQEIDEHSLGLLKKMVKINENLNLISLSARETSDLNQKLYDTSNIVTSSSQELAAITETGLVGLQEMSNSASSLSQMLLKMQKLISKFNTSIKPLDKRSVKPLKIHVISPTHAEFWDSVNEGVLYAKRELKTYNVDVILDLINELNPKAYINKFEECVKDGANAIAMVGFFDELIPFVNSCAVKGIPVMTFNSDFKEKSSRLAFFGQNPLKAGELAGKMMLEEIPSSGRLAIMTSDFTINDHNRRMNGFKAAIKNGNKMTVLYEGEIHDNDEEAFRKTKALLEKDRDINGIFIAAGGISGVAKAVESLGLTGKVKIVSFDFIQSTIQYIRKGIISNSIGQDPFGQGYNPVIYLFNLLMNGSKPEAEKMWSRMDVVNSRNVDDMLL